MVFGGEKIGLVLPPGCLLDNLLWRLAIYPTERYLATESCVARLLGQTPGFHRSSAECRARMFESMRRCPASKGSASTSKPWSS